MNRTLLTTLVALAVCGSAALADTIVLPNYYENNYGTTYQRSITGPTGQGRSYQMIFDSSQLTNIPVGAQITGITFRMPPTYTPWPLDTPATWDDYEIRIGTPATTVATMSRTFSANLSANVALVQDGPFEIPPYYFREGYLFPHQSLPFQQSWTYPGGDIIIEIRHPGGTFADAQPLNRGYLEAVHTSQTGWGTVCKGLIGGSFTATTGSYTYVFVTRLEYIPEPAALLSLLLGALTLLHRRG